MTFDSSVYYTGSNLKSESYSILNLLCKYFYVCCKLSTLYRLLTLCCCLFDLPFIAHTTVCTTLGKKANRSEGPFLEPCQSMSEPHSSLIKSCVQATGRPLLLTSDVRFNVPQFVSWHKDKWVLRPGYPRAAGLTHSITEHTHNSR